MYNNVLIFENFVSKDSEILRVISGYAKGRKLLTPPNMDTRPTSDRVKEAVFSIIQNHIMGSTFLDLFSGTGQIGIEALSRGASDCVFVDNSKESIAIINKNIEAASQVIPDINCKVLCADIADAIPKLKKAGLFNIIFMDPPYDSDLVEKALINIYDSNILHPDGFVIIEKPESKDINIPNMFNILNQKKYGSTSILIVKTEDV